MALVLREGYRENPQRITWKALRIVDDLLCKKSPKDLLDHEWKGLRFLDIFTGTYQMYREGVVTDVDVSEALQAKHGIKVATVESDPIAYIDTMILMRALVGGAFIEQARLDAKLSKVDINNGLSRTEIVPRNWLAAARAEKEGLTMVVQEDLEENWKREHRLLYDASQQVELSLAKAATRVIKRGIRRETMKPGLARDLGPQIRASWQDNLHMTALRAYMFFTPNSPETLPVQVEEQAPKAGA